MECIDEPCLILVELKTRNLNPLLDSFYETLKIKAEKVSMLYPYTLIF